MTLFRGFGDDLPLMEWLENYIWPAEARLEPEDVYWGTRLAAVEMLRSGTTTVRGHVLALERGRARRSATRGCARSSARC